MVDRVRTVNDVGVAADGRGAAVERGAGEVDVGAAAAVEVEVGGESNVSAELVDAAAEARVGRAANGDGLRVVGDIDGGAVGGVERAAGHDKAGGRRRIATA